ncbi:GNAT family N-acetyltransferase [Haloactinopolyspora alba]|uniref:GNAT family N-acetyltransferase n=1 Tax=Haloactinopolyspora alba TaxID=648780 RepID=UPI0013EA77CF
MAGPLTAADDLRRAAELYRRVFGYQDPSHSVNPRLLSSLAANGGSVVGAHDLAGEVIAFAYGFVGTDGEQVYHYSQAAVVDPAHQGTGLGRALKRAQRDVAVATGQMRMRWSYDPVLTRNGHFNLDVLGAVGRWFRRDLYGVPGTDRIIVDWDLDDDRRARAAAPARAYPDDAPAADDPAGWFHPHRDGDHVWVSLPSDLATAATERDRTPLDIRDELRRAVGALMADGYVAVSCVRAGERTAAYRFVPEHP